MINIKSEAFNIGLTDLISAESDIINLRIYDLMMCSVNGLIHWETCLFAVLLRVRRKNRYLLLTVTE